MADIVAGLQADANKMLLDAAAWAGVSVWSVIGAIAGAILLLLILVVWLIERKHHTATPSHMGDVQSGFVEKTLAEFPADMVKTEGGEGKIVIKLVTPKPVPEEKPQPIQEVKGEPLPTKPPVSEEPKEEEPEPDSKPIAMGTAEKPVEKK
jgi:hypothetical protein